MKILIAADSFKGSCSSLEVAQYVGEGIHSVCPDAEVLSVGIADGGEGTMETLTQALHGTFITCPAHDALMRPIQSRYGWLETEHLAILDMAETGGLTRIAPLERRPMDATTYGLGEQIAHALQHGARRILIGLGGSATTDGGVGMVRGMENGEMRMENAECIALCDVKNPLFGPEGAAYVFALQKGATPEQVALLDQRLRRLADSSAHPELAWVPGAGAAGGLGFAILNNLGGTLQPGIDTILDIQHFDDLLTGVDLVITGEGKIDAQTLMNKAPLGVLRRAQKHHIPCIAIAGRVEDRERLIAGGFADILCINPEGVPTEQAMQPEYCRGRLGEIGKMCKLCYLR